MTRRAVALGAAAGSLALTVGKPAMDHARPEPARHAHPLPSAAFLSHGAPSLALDARRGADLARWGAELRGRGLGALVVVSAHWERTPLSIGATTRRPLLHDYGGFAPELREVTYDAPAAADLAETIARGLGEGRALGAVERVPERPWDHGVWVPLVHLAPDRDVPVIQLSLASHLAPEDLLRLGARLRGLVDEHTLLLGSGGMVHNLGALDWSERSGPPGWATDFEAWARDVLARGDRDALVDYAVQAPAFRRAHPTPEHWLPLLVAAGAAERATSFPVEGFEYGSLSRLAVELAGAR